MDERTTDEVAAIFKAAGDSVTVIGIAKTSEDFTAIDKAVVDGKKIYS